MEETISLQEIFEVIKKRFILILSLSVAAVIIAAVVSYLIITPTYEAKTQFIVNQNNADPMAGYNVNDIRTNVEIINTYNDIIKSPKILDIVAEELDSGLSATQLAAKLQVASGNNSQVVNVTVTDIDPEMAVQIANTTVEVFKEQIPSIMNVNNVSILSPAVLSSNPQPVNPNPMLNMAIALVVGLMAGVGLAFLLEYLDQSVKDEKDLERHLGIPVLGVVAVMKEEDIKVRNGVRKPVGVVRSEAVGSFKKEG
ncbi:Wzz/FepE/Etk N-terminal domain-containing protein [Bacillaceae bacterium S4-13-56]